MISLVIPTLNEAAHLGSSLDSLEAQPGEFEVIVADGGSSDGTLEILAGYEDVRVCHSAPGRARQMNQGARAAKGEVLLFLHADTLLPPRGLELIRRAIQKPGVLAGSFFLRFDHQSPVLNFLSQMSRINLGILTYGDQGLFIRADWFKKHRGFADIALMEDIEIQRRLRKQGRFIKIQHPVTTSARRFLKNGIIRQELLNIGLVALYYAGMSPTRLKRIYQGE